jgi:hypothetical protein
LIPLGPCRVAYRQVLGQEPVAESVCKQSKPAN